MDQMLQSEDTEWLNGLKQKKNTHTYAAYKRLMSDRKTQRWKVRGWKNVFDVNGMEKKTRVAILILDKTDFKTKTVTIDKQEHYITIMRTINKKIQ